MEESSVQKSHHKKGSGPKAERKKKKNVKQDDDLSAKQRNPKAFSYHSVNKVAKVVRRALDVKEKKHHIPVVDHTPAEPPPIVVAVVGPPKVGKTTVIQGLIKNFTKQKLNVIKGPVTIVSGKKRRITLIECTNDINCMIDIAKIADLVLLLIDASFGFEMEIFEFLNICQVHGFPKILGVLTHLDHLKNNKALSVTKKKLKHRFWTEVYQGAKLFYLSGMVNGHYLDREIKNLGRFISVMKFRPLQWRTSHPHLLTDRVEDVTDPEKIRTDAKCDRSVCLYGYLRGTHLRSNSHVAIPGCGDFIVYDVTLLPDPCPLPDVEKKRSLNEKERLIYAPFSGVGGIVYDKYAVYVDLGGSQGMKDDDDDAEEDLPTRKLVSNIMETRTTIDQKMETSKVKLFTDTSPLTSVNIDDSDKVISDLTSNKNNVSNTEIQTDDDDEDDDGEEDSENLDENSSSEADLSDVDSSESDSVEDLLEQIVSSKTHVSPLQNVSTSNQPNDISEEKLLHNSDTTNLENLNTSSIKWKQNLEGKAQEAFFSRQRDTPNLCQLVYGSRTDQVERNTEEQFQEYGGLFKITNDNESNKSHSHKYKESNAIDCSKFKLDVVRDWLDNTVSVNILDCFVTGNWEAEKDAKTLLDQDEELFGDFEDLEAEEKLDDEKPDEEKEDSEAQEELNEEDNYQFGDASIRKEQRTTKIKEKREAKKKRMKAMFDAEYDRVGGNEDKGTFFDEWKAEMELQSRMNREEFKDMDEATRTQYEGFRPGQYVRVQINHMPSEMIEHFDPSYPIIVGGLLNAEQNIGFVHVRMKKHRWHKQILKTRDPVIVSLGWRRFQTLALFSIQDHNGRHRLLKYTPEHLHCEATIWGPITPQNTGFLTIQTVGNNTSDFRITSTGVVLELDKSFTIMKKLKLTGTPFKIYKRTAFVQGMFNSNLEVAKFEGSSIRTVSGVRGQIKRAVKEGIPGSFRATFEDKILLSDIIFVKTWYPVDVPQFYNPVTTLLESVSQRTEWQGMRTVGQIRRERGIKREVNEDHLYKTSVERKKKRLAPLVIPKELQNKLPFKSKPKDSGKYKKDNLQTGRVAVIRSDKERQVAQLMKVLKVLDVDKRNTLRNEMKARVTAHRKEKAKVNAVRDQKQKEVKKKIFRLQGQIEKKKQK